MRLNWHVDSVLGRLTARSANYVYTLTPKAKFVGYTQWEPGFVDLMHEGGPATSASPRELIDAVRWCEDAADGVTPPASEPEGEDKDEFSWVYTRILQTRNEAAKNCNALADRIHSWSLRVMHLERGFAALEGRLKNMYDELTERLRKLEVPR